MAKRQTQAARPRSKRHTVKLTRPGANSVVVTGDFCDWARDGFPLQHDGGDTWKTSLSLPPGRYEYRFIVDGEWSDDPECHEHAPNPFGSENCVFRV